MNRSAKGIVTTVEPHLSDPHLSVPSIIWNDLFKKLMPNG